MTTTAVEPTPHAPARLRARTPDLALLAGTAVLATAAFLLVHRALIDDAYITMSYARNLAFGLHWGLIPDETANSATSPLNVLLLAVITALVRDAHVAVGVLFVVTAVVGAHWLAALARQLGLSRVAPVLGVVLLLVDPLLLSTTGLESYLGAALVIGLLRCGAAGRPVAFGVVGGLAVLARPDLAVFVLVALVAFRGVRRRTVPALGAVALVALPWHALSWVLLGSALPDTLVMKADAAAWAGYGFWNGPLLYHGSSPRAAELAFLPVALGLVALLAAAVRRVARPAPWQAAALAAGGGAIAHYLAYCVLRPAPYHWYYAPLVVGTTLCLVVVVGRLAAVARRAVAAGAVAALAALALASAVFDTVQLGVPWTRAVIGTNWATAAEYERIGTDLRGLAGDRVVESPGEIGTLAYYCGCRIVDPFSDRGRVLAAITAREERSGPLARTLLRLNYLHLDRAQQPRPVDLHLQYEGGVAPSGPLQWPVDHWAEAPGRMVLLPGPR